MLNNRRLAKLLSLRSNDIKFLSKTLSTGNGQLSKNFSTGNGQLKGVSSSTVRAADDVVFDTKVEKYSAYQPTPVSMSHFIDFGRNASLQSR